MTRLRMVVETTRQKTFASAWEWPGWSRGTRTNDAALESLLGYRERYATVARLAKVDLPEPSGTTVIDTLDGNASTSYGVPALFHEVDFEPMDDAECGRQLALLQASWRFFEEVVATVTPELRKGPRGGGRDRDEIVDHVVLADRSYARKIGVMTPPIDPFNQVAVGEHRKAVFAAIPDLRSGGLTAPNGWPVRYALRRMAWHVLDHAWEMEDKDLTGKDQS